MQVANCYIRVTYRDLDRSEFQELSRTLYHEAEALAALVKRGEYFDYALEQGTLFQRIVVVGMMLIGGLVKYHDLRESVIQMSHDAETFGTKSFDVFHGITRTTEKHDLYKRKTSRDLSRVNRIIGSFDAVEEGHLSRLERQGIRQQVIHDLAELVRSNRNDPEIAKFIELLPKGEIPDFPQTPEQALRMDQSYAHTKAPAHHVEHPRQLHDRAAGETHRRFHGRASIRH
jgi:hypothetical protein